MRFSARFVRLFVRKYVAPVLLNLPDSASLSPSCAELARGELVEMIKVLRQLLLVLSMLGVVSAGAFAQGKDKDKRPPKEPAKVITNDRKDQRPPRQNTNQQPPKRDKRDRPD